MTSNAELERRLNNILQVGEICEARRDGFVRVDILGLETDFLPCFSKATGYKRAFSPVQLGEQVMILSPRGDTNDGYVLRDIPFENEFDSENEFIEFEDGTKIEIKMNDFIKVETSNNFILKAKNIEIDENGNVKIKGEITDNKGNLTTHEHDIKEHSKAIERS